MICVEIMGVIFEFFQMDFEEDDDDDEDESDDDDQQEKKIKQTVAKMVGGGKSVSGKLSEWKIDAHRFYLQDKAAPKVLAGKKADNDSVN